MKIIFAVIVGALSGWFGFSIFSDERQEPSFVDSSNPSDPVHISIITDIDRCKTRAFATQDNLDRFVRFANARKAGPDGKTLDGGDRPSDLAISLGDNIAHRLEGCSDTADDDLQFVAEAMDGLMMPMHYVLGDHDIDQDPDTLTTWRAHTGRAETFYSFDHGDVHIVVLDTILGGSSLLPCEKDSQCSALLAEKAELKSALADYADKKNAATDDTSDTAKVLGKKDVLAHRARITSVELMIESHKKAATHLASDDVRDHGLIGKQQLLWLAHDLATTENSKILLFADHPLFPFTTTKKSYQIDDLDALTTILHDARDVGKVINVTSGEAHTWSRKEIEGITYHIIDEFRSQEGSWAHAVWDDDFTVYKVIDDKIKTDL